MEIDCAGCGRPMKAVLGICGHCRRPNDENEIASGLAAARERRERPVRLAVWTAIFLLVGAGLYARRGALRKGAASFSQAAATLQTRAPQAPRAASQSGPSPSAPPPAPPEPTLGPNDWALTGRVFDLKTLKPVAGVKMIFLCPERGLSRVTALDEFGRYGVALPVGVTEGFAIRVDAPGYVSSALAEPDVPYAQLAAADRAQLIESADGGDAASSRVVEPENGQPENLDVFLAPQRPEGGARP